MTSLAARIATLSEADRHAVFDGMSTEQLVALEYSWPFWARPDQLPPPVRPGDPTWRTWLILAGRGWGKTRTGAEWVRAEAEAGKRAQLGVLAPTAHAARAVMIEGPSGLLATAPPGFRPSYEPALRRLVYPNGCICHVFSAEEPDRLRGPNLDGAWADEIAAWANLEETWNMLQLALRLEGPKGHAPQVCVTTTPKPLPLLKAIIAAPSTVITRGRTLDNSANLDASTLKYLQDKYGGTTLGRQELAGELLEDAEQALWNRMIIEESRVAIVPDSFKRIVVAIDPAGGSSRGNAETGILAAALGVDGHVYVLTDASGKLSPDAWARRAVDTYRLHKADRIVAERNFGGEMVEGTIRSVAPNVPVKMVTASRGKSVRAEPVVALYEQRKVHHVGNFPALEDQLCTWEPNNGMASPDRLDALVWAVTELALGTQAKPTRMTNLNWIGR
jgi:phage terminase large subunit-like protein